MLEQVREPALSRRIVLRRHVVPEVHRDQRRAVMEKMEKIIQDSGIIVQPYWRSTFRHMTEAVNGLVMHPTFEIHLETTWLTA